MPRRKKAKYKEALAKLRLAQTPHALQPKPPVLLQARKLAVTRPTRPPSPNPALVERAANPALKKEEQITLTALCIAYGENVPDPVVRETCKTLKK